METFFHSFFVYSKNIAYYPPGAILGTMDIAGSKVHKISSHGIYILLE